MKPTIAIIGLGSTGSALAARLADHTYRLLLVDQDVSKVQTLTDKLVQSANAVDVEPIDSKVTACWEADILVLAVPESAKKAIAEQIRQVATCKIVISLAVLSNDNKLDTQVSEELQQWLPNSKVVNVLIASSEEATLSDNAFLSGTHEGAIATVSDLLTVANLTPIVVEDWSV
ncbi:NAD(P)-binding domain-containing protein [Spirosoma gilvum]